MLLALLIAAPGTAQSEPRADDAAPPVADHEAPHGAPSEGDGDEGSSSAPTSPTEDDDDEAPAPAASPGADAPATGREDLGEADSKAGDATLDDDGTRDEIDVDAGADTSSPSGKRAEGSAEDDNVERNSSAEGPGEQREPSRADPNGADAGDAVDRAQQSEKPDDAPKVIKPSKGSPYWEDSERFSASVARGAVGVCEAATLPAALVPGVGTAAAIVIEYLCILPGALALDYAATHHGDDPDGALLEGALALFASKLWRDVTRLPAYIAMGVFAGVVIAGLAAFVAGSAILLPFAALWVAVPAALGASSAALLSLALATSWVRDAGADAIFWGVYDGVGDLDDQPKSVARQRPDSAEDGWLDPPLDPCSRCFTLSAVSAGAEAPFEWSHAIPVVGPWHRAQAKRDRHEDDLNRLARDVFKEHKNVEEQQTVSTTLDVLAITSGTLGAMTHVGLGVALVGAAVSLIAVPLVFTLPFVGVPLLVGAGLVALTGGLAGLASYGGQSLVRALEAVIVPLAFGALPDGRTPDTPETSALPAPAPEQVAQRF